MTALSEYQRLEAPGTWRPAPGAQRREVIVSVGEATLVMTDQSERALAHWSLAALERRNPGERPALYAPGPDATEDLEIADGDMIDAIERVRRAVEKARPRPGRLRARIALGVLVAVLLAAIFWAPGALIRHAARVAPEAARVEIGEALLREVAAIAGAPCRAGGTDRALSRLHTRLAGEVPGGVLVMRLGGQAALHLPGGIVIIDRTLVEDYETPEVAAGYILAERLRAAETPPLLRFFDGSGMRVAAEFLTTGHVDPAALGAYAEYLLTARPAPVADSALTGAFDAARVRAAPYAYAVDPSGEATVGLIEADPVPPGGGEPILADGDWVALQGVCGG